MDLYDKIEENVQFRKRGQRSVDSALICLRVVPNAPRIAEKAEATKAEMT
jgi:hypothetical protein